MEKTVTLESNICRYFKLSTNIGLLKQIIYFSSTKTKKIILMATTFKEILMNEFGSKGILSKEDIKRIYFLTNGNVKESTLNWRINYLIRQNVIQPISKNLYSFSIKPEFKQNLSREAFAVVKKFVTTVEDVKHSIWETAWLNVLSQHQMMKNLIILEVEKDFLEHAFYMLKEEFQHRVFLNPQKEVMELYVAETDSPIVLKRLIGRSPLYKNVEKNIVFYTPLLEKLLVDIFTDREQFFMLNGSEIEYIFSSALEHYSVNFTKMFDYAKRRGIKQKLQEFLSDRHEELLIREQQ